MKKHVFGTRWDGIGRGQDFLYESTRLGQGTSKIVVLAKQPYNFNKKSRFFCFWVDLPG